MKQGLSYAFFGTVVAVAAGLFGAYGIPDFSQTETSSFASAYILGHVTYTVTDENGNIKAYRQLDNIIVDQGEDCAATLLFTNVTRGGSVLNPETQGTEVVPDNPGGAINTCFAITTPYVHIAIGNGSAGVNSAAGDDTDLVNEHLESEDPGIGLSRISDSRPTFTAATGGATPAKVVLSKDFTLDFQGGDGLGGNPAVGTQIVNESGLFNFSSVNRIADVGMFARQTFADVSIGDGETLTVEWTINIGGAATLGGSEEL